MVTDEDVINYYNDNKSIYWIHKTTKISCYHIRKILMNANVEMKTKAQRQNPSFNENFFENIDTEAKAYWLGWLITDGCISRGGISLVLQKRDLHILELMQKDLGLENHIKPFGENYVRFQVWSKKMVNDLSKYGIVPNKTNTVIVPDVSNEFIPPLIRGCMDGDGGLSIITSRGKYELELSFCGNYDNVAKMNYLISQFCDLTPRNIVKNNSIWRIRWFKASDVLTICSFLYDNANEHRLNRKYNKYQQIKQHFNDEL